MISSLDVKYTSGSVIVARLSSVRGLGASTGAKFFFGCVWTNCAPISEGKCVSWDSNHNTGALAGQYQAVPLASRLMLPYLNTYEGTSVAARSYIKAEALASPMFQEKNASTATKAKWTAMGTGDSQRAIN